MKFNIQRFGDYGGIDPYSPENTPGGNVSSGTFAEMNYGIRKIGITNIYNELHTYLDKDCKEALENYNVFFEKLREYWKGQDREVFITNLMNAVKKVENKWDECDGLIKQEFEKIRVEWEDFESTNVKERN